MIKNLFFSFILALIIYITISSKIIIEKENKWENIEIEFIEPEKYNVIWIAPIKKA